MVALEAKSGVRLLGSDSSNTGLELIRVLSAQLWRHVTNSVCRFAHHQHNIINIK